MIQAGLFDDEAPSLPADPAALRERLEASRVLLGVCRKSSLKTPGLEAYYAAEVTKLEAAIAAIHP